MSAHTAMDRLKAAVQRHGITYADVAQRVATDENIPASDALNLVNRLEFGTGCPTIVAVAIISIIVDKGKEGKLQ